MSAHPSGSCSTAAPHGRRHNTPEAAAAIGLVADAYLKYKIQWIAARLCCRIVENDGAKKAVISLNRYVVHEGDADSADEMKATLPLRLATAVDIRDRLCVHEGRWAEDTNRISDFWQQPDQTAADWLHASLREGDRVSQSALEIAALVGGPRWQAYAGTLANIRTGTTLPWTPCAVAAARNEDHDCFVRDWDELTIFDILDHMTESHGRCARTVRKRRAKPTVECGSLCAVEIEPGQWDLSQGPSFKSRGMPAVDTKTMAQMLASVRVASHYSKDIVFCVCGHMHASIALSTKHIGEQLAYATIDGDSKRTNAIVSAATLIHDTRTEDLAAIASTIEKAKNAANNSGGHTTQTTSTVEVSAPLSRISWLTDLCSAVDDQDSSRLRLLMGDVWDAATPSSYIGCANSTFVADAHGVWRDAFGMRITWMDFVRLARTKRRTGSASVDVTMPGPRCIGVPLTREDPRHADDFAYGLCREALAGDRRAVDWLSVLGLASPQWAMLNDTVCRVLSWMDDGVSSAGNGASPGRLLIDWVLDVSPTDDINVRHAAIQDDFNETALANFDGTRCHIAGVCQCVAVDRDDNASTDGGPCNGLCKMRSCDKVTVFGVLPEANPVYVITYRGTVTSLLTCVPLVVNGRQILATEAFCPLLGDRARGVEALVRALYTCEPLRVKVIAPAQLALAERALGAASI